MKINIEISCGELIDKLSILTIKTNNIKDESKLRIINDELKELKKVGKKLKNKNSEKYNHYLDSLIKVNSDLWRIEDEIRKFEKKGVFNKNFIDLARSVYIQNDKRFEIKNEINEFFNSNFKEQKEYEDYKN
jgi:hypothetical protein|tara:strand:- start:750 stop:1145 length:396 start_codon:yes stop_codon:yes gene_type:complete